MLSWGCEFCGNQCFENHFVLKGINGILPVSSTFFTLSGSNSVNDMFTGTLLIECDCHENQRCESHVFLGDVNECLSPLSSLLSD